MYHMKLLTIKNDTIVEKLGREGYQGLGNNLKFSKCKTKAHEKFKKINQTNQLIVGYVIYSGFVSKPKLKFSYVLDPYRFKNLELGKGS